MDSFSPVLKRLLLTLVLLCCVSSVVVAGDYDHDVEANERGDNATTLKKFKQAAAQVIPPLTDWLEKARPLNPGVSDEDLLRYWRKKYALVLMDTEFAQFQLILFLSPIHRALRMCSQFRG